MLIYRITNTVNSKSYVGLTSRSVRQRWTEHRRDAKKGSSLPLHSALRKYGPDSFKIEVLEECDSIEYLCEREQHWIQELGTFGGGYNATAGGEGSIGHTVTDEHRRILSEVNQGNQNAIGYHHTDEARKRIGDAARMRDAIGSQTRGKKLSKERVENKRVQQFKSVIKCDMNGQPLAYFESMLAAAKSLNTTPQGISRCCRYPSRSALGFKWRYGLQDEVFQKIEGNQ